MAAFFDRARAPPAWSAAIAARRGCTSSAARRAAPRRNRVARAAFDRRAPRRRRRRRAPLARGGDAPLRRGAGARAGRRRRRAPPDAPPRRRRHLHHRPQRQLHERLRHPLQVLQLLPPAHQQDRGLRAVARGAGPEVPGDGRPGRRADPAAGRPQPQPADRLVRGSLPLDEGQLPAGHPRPLARGDPLHRRDREHADPRGDRAADRRRASTRSPAAAPRSSTTRSATPSRRSSARPTPGWR